MNEFFNQVEACVKYPDVRRLALAGAVMIPDICGAMERPAGSKPKSRYVAWFKKWLPQYTDKAVTGF